MVTVVTVTSQPPAGVVCQSDLTHDQAAESARLFQVQSGKSQSFKFIEVGVQVQVPNLKLFPGRARTCSVTPSESAAAARAAPAPCPLPPNFPPGTFPTTEQQAQSPAVT